MDDFFGSPWVWGIIGLAAGVGIGMKVLGHPAPQNPVYQLNELRSDWTNQCIKSSTAQGYPAPTASIDNCTEKGLKLIPVGQRLDANAQDSAQASLPQGSTDQKF